MPIMKSETLSLETIQGNLRKVLPELASQRENLSNKLTEAGAGIDTCAKVLSEIAQFSDDDNTRLRAIELTLKGHNALEDNNRGDGSIHFHFADSGQVNLQNIFNPPRPEPIIREPLGMFDKIITEDNQIQ